MLGIDSYRLLEMVAVPIQSVAAVSRRPTTCESTKEPGSCVIGKLFICTKYVEMLTFC